MNIGNMAKRSGQPLFLPCTPRGIIELLKHSIKDISGKRAVVLGRSDIVVSACVPQIIIPICIFFPNQLNPSCREPLLLACLLPRTLLLHCAIQRLRMSKISYVAASHDDLTLHAESAFYSYPRDHFLTSRSGKPISLLLPLESPNMFRRIG
jgi:Tetrahydrofolate dehydrogenase/cyclohydrolase, NAD(P)-binding domain